MGDIMTVRSHNVTVTVDADSDVAYTVVFRTLTDIRCAANERRTSTHNCLRQSRRRSNGYTLLHNDDLSAAVTNLYLGP